MSLSSKLAGQKFPHQDVTISLDGELSAQRDKAMVALVDATRQKETGQVKDARLTRDPVSVARKEVDRIENLMRESSITIRITAVSFGEYNKFIIQNPPRKGNESDQALGFNSQTFFLFVAKRTGKYVDDDGTVQDITDDEWAQIEAKLTDGDHDRIANAVIEVNRRMGARGVDFLSQRSGTTPESSATSA